jgi:ATP phosphoribosyltransferase
MTAPFVFAVPSKGRLQENAEAFFTRAGLTLAKPLRMPTSACC